MRCRGGRQGGVDIHTGIIQLLGDGEGGDFLIGVNRDDGCLAHADLDATREKLLAEILGNVLQLIDKPGIILQLGQRRQCRGAGGRRDGGGEDEGAGAVAHIFRHHVAGCHIAAERSKALGEGAHIDVHIILQTEIAGRATAAIAQNAQTVCVIHHHSCAVLLGKADDFGQVCNVAAHGEHAIGDDEGTGTLGHHLQQTLQIGHVVVLIALHGAIGQAAAVIDAGVVFTVADHPVATPHHGGNDAEVGLEAGGEGDHILLAQELGKASLQLLMQPQGAVEEAGAGAAGAILLQCVNAGLHNPGIGGQAKVVVGAEHDATLALHDHLDILPGFKGMEIGINVHSLRLCQTLVILAFCENVSHVLSSVSV